MNETTQTNKDSIFGPHYKCWFTAGIAAGGLARLTKQYWIPALPVAVKFPGRYMMPPQGLDGTISAESQDFFQKNMENNLAELGFYAIGFAASHADIAVSKVIEYGPIIKQGIEQIIK